jgi:hypothetical protein
MLSLGLSITSPAVLRSASYDAASLAIFAAFTTPPGADDRSKINQLVTTLKAASVWSDLDILYVLASADSQAARINWKSPGVKTLNAVNSPTFAAYRGYTGNGTTSRLDTGWIPSTEAVKYLQNDASLWVWSRSTAQGASFALGNANIDPVANIQPRNTGDFFATRINNGSGSNILVASVNASGMFGGQRRSSTDVRGWKNGAQIVSGSIASTGRPTDSQWILASNFSLFDNRQIAFAAWGASLAGKELVFYNAMNAYMQAVGAA